jgi:hypothetical protein
MATLASILVVPYHAQVALLDGGWQSYPKWEDGTEDVAIGDHGIAVATRADDGISPVRIDVLVGPSPGHMRLIHGGTLTVGAKGIVVGNWEDKEVPVALPAGVWRVDVCVDVECPDLIGHVVFVLNK